MRHSDNFLKRDREHHPQVGIGLFFIVLGLALLVATNDMLGLGSIKEYFTWQSAMIFIGVLFLLNLNVVPGLLLIAGGVWFVIDKYEMEIPDLVRTVYWPGVIIIIGIGLIISSFFKRKKQDN